LSFDHLEADIMFTFLVLINIVYFNPEYIWFFSHILGCLQLWIMRTLKLKSLWMLLFCIYFICVFEMTSVPWKGLMFDYMSNYNILIQL